LKSKQAQKGQVYTISFSPCRCQVRLRQRALLRHTDFSLAVIG